MTKRSKPRQAATGASSLQNYSRFFRRSRQRNRQRSNSQRRTASSSCLRTKVAELRAMLANMRQREEDLQRDRDHWRTAFENTQRRLRRAWRWMRATG